VVRAAVVFVVWGAVLGLPQGGGSEAYVRARDTGDEDAAAVEPLADSSPGEPALAQPSPGEPALAEPERHEPQSRISYPRFLRPLPADRGQPRRRDDPASRREPREVLLSFDDGPDLFGTPLVLDALDRHGKKAIFFVNGRYLLGTHPIDLQRRELVRKLAAHGHLVANHTLTHRNLCREPETAADEIDTNSEIIAYATGLRPLLFRSPYGARCRSLDAQLRERDLISVGWNVDPQEWRGASGGQDAVFDYVTHRLSQIEGRAILLLHDTHPAAVHALPRILDWIDEENARLAREGGGAPLRVVDYGVFVPERDVPATGLEPILSALGRPLALLPRRP
jgi:peptidoglycan/xylan/chitin deacetylase (PgdA/CDA1 family)